MEKYFKERDFLTALFFLAFDAIYLGFGMQIPVSDSSSVGAGFMPRVYGFIMLLVALVLLVSSIRKVNRRTAEENAAVAASMAVDRRDVVRIAIAFAAILVYVLMLKGVGFILCSIPLLFLLVVLLTPQYVVDRYVDKKCRDGSGQVRPECQNARGGVKPGCMAGYYGKILAFAVAFTVAVYLLFNFALGLKMPQGVLRNILP